MLYKGIEVEEVFKSGNVDLVEGMYNSVMSRKSRNKGNKKIVSECEKVLSDIEKWKEEKGISKGGKRGIYDDVKSVEGLSEEELGGMYESLYSRRSYYKKIGNVEKVKELEKRLEVVKGEKVRRNRVKVLGE